MLHVACWRLLAANYATSPRVVKQRERESELCIICCLVCLNTFASQIDKNPKYVRLSPASCSLPLSLCPSWGYISCGNLAAAATATAAPTKLSSYYPMTGRVAAHRTRITTSSKLNRMLTCLSVPPSLCLSFACFICHRICPSVRGVLVAGGIRAPFGLHGICSCGILH